MSRVEKMPAKPCQVYSLFPLQLSISLPPCHVEKYPGPRGQLASPSALQKSDQLLIKYSKELT